MTTKNNDNDYHVDPDNIATFFENDNNDGRTR